MEKILIVDDSRLDVKVLADILKEEYEVITALTGEEGLKRAKEELPVLILLDIVMPVMDGFEILKELKNTESTKEIPVIFLTALTDEKTEEKGLLNGAIDYIKKPFNTNIVRARVRTHVNLHLYMRTIENQLSVDSLTGAFNRRAFEIHKVQIWNHAKAHNVPLSMFVADIDYFKRVNDTYGHGEGDHVLKIAVTEMRKKLNDEDTYLARYGGEEFVAILHNKTVSEAQIIAEEIRESIRKLNIPNEKSDVCPYLTISIGGSTIVPTDDSSVDELLETADSMLYEAKAGGRNQTCWKSK